MEIADIFSQPAKTVTLVLVTSETFTSDMRNYMDVVGFLPCFP